MIVPARKSKPHRRGEVFHHQRFRHRLLEGFEYLLSGLSLEALCANIPETLRPLKLVYSSKASGVARGGSTHEYVGRERDVGGIGGSP